MLGTFLPNSKVSSLYETFRLSRDTQNRIQLVTISYKPFDRNRNIKRGSVHDLHCRVMN